MKRLQGCNSLLSIENEKEIKTPRPLMAGETRLTGKTQLSDLWNIDLDASALAAANHFEMWVMNTDEAQPSLDYKQVSMKSDSSKSLPTKRKRASRHRHKDLQQVQDHRSSRHNGNVAQKNLFLNQPKRISHTNLLPHEDFNQLSSNTLDTLPLPHGRKGNKSKNTVIDSEFKILARDLGILLSRNHSIPRVRSERESGKRRDLVGINRNAPQYLIASSVSNPMSPSQVEEINLKQEETVNVKKNNKKLMKTTNSTNSRQNTIESFFHFDENVSKVQTAIQANTAGNVTNLMELQKIDKKEAKKLCYSLKLTTYQRKRCKRDSGLPQVLAKATHIAAAECMYQFRYERWNCSLGTSRLHLLNRGNKETAFLYSISSAGLTYSIARACAEGYLESCSCEETFADRVNQEAWLWGGCGDNVHFAAKFVKKFLRRRQDNLDVRSEIDKHNSDLGIRFVKSNVRPTCKCHGVSGSCTTKSCWRKMAPFHEIGKKIKRAYDKAVKVENTSNASGRPKLVRVRTTRRRQKPSASSSSAQSRKSTKKKNPKLLLNTHRTRSTTNLKRTASFEEVKEIAPKKKELVYLENSPRYCKKTKYSLGTKGRICGKQSNCERMCCGRGYTTHVRIIRRSCECQVKWCCYVECKTCNERKQIRTCM